MFRELSNRIDTVLQDEALLSAFKKMKWISNDSRFWPYSKYNIEAKKLESLGDHPGLPTEVMKDHVKALIRHAGEGDNAIMRFHPVRPLVEHMSGDTLLFLLQAGSQSESAAQMCLHLKALCGLSVTQLCAFSIAPDRLQRSGQSSPLLLHFEERLHNSSGRTDSSMQHEGDLGPQEI